MEPQVRYSTTEDGVRIGYSAEGQGPPLIWCAEPQASHLRLERTERWSEVYLDLANWFRVVRFDARGLGLSDRDIADLSLDSRVLDIEAVVSKLGLKEFVMVGGTLNASVVVRFASKHPEQVQHVVLYDSVIRVADLFATSQVQAVAGLLEHDWEMFTENVGTVIFGWGVEDARRHGSFLRSTASPAEVRQYIAALATDDATTYLAELPMPVLVIHHTALTYVGIDRMRKLTASLPDARLVLIEGRFLDHPDVMVEAIVEHCGLDPSKAREGAGRPTGTRRYHPQRPQAAMASFGSVTKAVECAVALQRAFAEREGEPLSACVGLNAGEPIEEDGDLFGATVILASRIATKAEGGEILVADTVRGLCSGKGFLFADRGEFVAKGIEEPVRVYEVSWR